MMKTNSQKRILPLALSGGILICLICIYSGRSVLLRSIVNRHTSRIEQTHGLCIHYDKLEMNGLNEISLQGLSVIPEQRDTLFTLFGDNRKALERYFGYPRTTGYTIHVSINPHQAEFLEITHQENRSKLHSSRRYQTHIYKARLHRQL